MPNKTIYVSDEDGRIWNAAATYAKATDTSVSKLIAKALALYLKHKGTK